MEEARAFYAVARWSRSTRAHAGGLRCVSIHRAVRPEAARWRGQRADVLRYQARKFGQFNNFRTFGDDLGGIDNTYNGVDLTVNARLRNVTVQAGFSTGNRVEDDCGIAAAHPEVYIFAPWWEHSRSPPTHLLSAGSVSGRRSFAIASRGGRRTPRGWRPTWCRRSMCWSAALSTACLSREPISRASRPEPQRAGAGRPDPRGGDADEPRTGVLERPGRSVLQPRRAGRNTAIASTVSICDSGKSSGTTTPERWWRSMSSTWRTPTRLTSTCRTTDRTISRRCRSRRHACSRSAPSST